MCMLSKAPKMVLTTLANHKTLNGPMKITSDTGQLRQETGWDLSTYLPTSTTISTQIMSMV